MADDSTGVAIEWSGARPWSLWIYAALNFLLAVYFTIFIAEGDVIAVNWVVGLILLYFVWRGSRTAWGISVVGVALYLIVSAIEVEMAVTPGGHHPVVHVIESGFLIGMLVVLVLPQTRTFCRVGATPKAS